MRFGLVVWEKADSLFHWCWWRDRHRRQHWFCTVRTQSCPRMWGWIFEYTKLLIQRMDLRIHKAANADRVFNGMISVGRSEQGKWIYESGHKAWLVPSVQGQALNSLLCGWKVARGWCLGTSQNSHSALHGCCLQFFFPSVGSDNEWVVSHLDNEALLFQVWGISTVVGGGEKRRYMISLDRPSICIDSATTEMTPSQQFALQYLPTAFQPPLWLVGKTCHFPPDQTSNVYL